MADCRNRFWPETSARREFELIRLLAEEGTERMRVLWLRKCSRTSSLHQHVPGQPSQRREAAHPQAQQDADAAHARGAVLCPEGCASASLTGDRSSNFLDNH